MPKQMLNGIDYNSGMTQDLVNKIGTDTLDTTAQDLSGAVNEHEEDITEIKSNLTDLIKTLNLGSITTNANGMYIVSQLMFDEAIVLASKGTYGDGFFTEQRPSVSGNVVLKCMDDNNTILKSKTITNVVLYYIEK